jgi:hypothetical protein
MSCIYNQENKKTIIFQISNALGKNQIIKNTLSLKRPTIIGAGHKHDVKGVLLFSE